LTPTRRCLYFTAPRQIEVRKERLPDLASGQVLVQTLLSAISPGTEVLIYNGLFPDELPVDESIPTLSGKFAYPLKYGYCAVGRIVQLGKDVDSTWKDRLVFAFNPHECHFFAKPEDLLPLPHDVSPEEGVFLPSMETALNLVMDGKPLIGESTLVFGQGIIGLLSTALLALFPLSSLVTLDRYALRRQTSLELGAHASLDPSEPTTGQRLHDLLPAGADLTYEVSGTTEALDDAIAMTGFAGRVVIGSWYGKQRASLHLGGRFHRNRIRLVSSQVSTLSPELSGRWSKRRRFEVAWEMLRKVRPSRFVTHRFPIEQAGQAYKLIDQHPESCIQVLLTY
jgi:2-desacetyl-2-hydroxyethyl bacteriochlorophyllide A dehydrogenase